MGLPTSSSSISGVFSKFASSKNFLNFNSPIFFAINKVPIFEDLIKISSTDKFFGKSLISDISYFEHLTDRGIFFSTVCGFTKLLSKANATVKVLKIDPSS